MINKDKKLIWLQKSLREYAHSYDQTGASGDTWKKKVLFSLVDTYHRMKYYGRIAASKELYYPVDIRMTKELIGNREAPWCIASDILNKNSIIYSFGVGTNVSFDIGLIEKLGCQVFAFDPTPRSIEWIRKQKVPPQFKYMDYGISDRDGVMMFYPPANPGHVSFSAEIIQKSPEGVKLPVYRLQTIMDKLGHATIDLLKIDIEGSEYGVIRDLLNSEVDVKQILVEFHHRFNRLNMGKTREAINALRSKGFKIFYISPNGEEYSFIRRNSAKIPEQQRNQSPLIVQ